jgi:hypothetical protein
VVVVVETGDQLRQRHLGVAAQEAVAEEVAVMLHSTEQQLNHPAAPSTELGTVTLEAG